LGDIEPVIEILIKNKKDELKDFLRIRRLRFDQSRIYALRTFVEDYLEK